MILASTKRVSLVPAKREHVRNLMRDLRDADRAEWLAWTGVPFRPALEWCVTQGIALTAIHKNGQVVTMVGVQDIEGAPPGTGLLWFAAANLGYEVLPDFAYLTVKALEVLHQRYPNLVAYSDARNAIHHDWLDQTGWTITGYVETGKHPTHTFLKAERTRP